MDTVAENDAVYQALLEHKKKQLSMQNAHMQETLSIMEQAARKRKEADETRSVVTALSHYSSNVRFVSPTFLFVMFPFLCCLLCFVLM